MKKLVVPAMLVSLVPVIVALLTALGADLTPVLSAVCNKQVPVVVQGE